MLYLSHIAAAFSVGLLFRFYKKHDTAAESIPIFTPEKGMGEIFQKALAGSINSILTVCGAVVFFSVIANITADLLSGNRLFKTLFLSLSELTTGINSIAALDATLWVKLILSAAAAGFAGFCVHLQVMGVAAGRGLSLVPYIVGKAIHALLAAAYMSVLLHIFPITAAVFAGGATIYGSFFAAAVYTSAGAAILAIIAALLMIFGRKRFHRRRSAVN